jgi:hypothetical protein
VRHGVTAGDLLFDLDKQVGERGAPCRDDMPQGGVAARPPDAEVGEVIIDQLVDGRQLSVVPYQIPEAADDRGVVLLGSHGILLSARPARLVPGSRTALCQNSLTQIPGLKKSGRCEEAASRRMPEDWHHEP